MMRLDRFAADLGHQALVRVERARSHLDMCGEVLASSAERAIERQRAWLAMAEEVIEARSPKQILRLGFAVVRSGGKAILSAEEAKVGDRITIELSQGECQAEIVE
jgi:exodeoxyribonuclease VII large subunit